VHEDPTRAVDSDRGNGPVRRGRSTRPPRRSTHRAAGYVAGDDTQRGRGEAPARRRRHPFRAEQACDSADDAVAVAEQFGFPVVMKILSPDILHKSEIGGVLFERE